MLQSPQPDQFSYDPPSSPTFSPGSSSSDSFIEDVLFPGDIVGKGCLLQGQVLEETRIHHNESVLATKEFQVIRRLGTGSYAVVYLVREIISRPRHKNTPSDDQGVLGHIELDPVPVVTSGPIYGPEYAIKCLSKANLDQDALASQMTEVIIHQSLRPHPNIVTLHTTFQTPSFLLLLLEYVPGQDLYYFLEQSRDHDDTVVSASFDSGCSLSSTSSHTPPTPSLLSTLDPAHILSRTRLRLIASMFSQMCDAVAACHEQQVFHRDIKPENFIVTDVVVSGERKVVVKLTDFGLSTTDIESCDMDCGSAPYMSYECRNNIAPSYRPGPADVWSLGIVLINMLYHSNPWTDTYVPTTLSPISPSSPTETSQAFEEYRQQPVEFFISRFPGLTREVAMVLAEKVFCILGDDQEGSERWEAKEFGKWIKDLPCLLGQAEKVLPVSTPTQNLAPIPASHRPTSRNPSRCGTPLLRAAGSISTMGTPILPTMRELEVRIPPAPEDVLFPEEHDAVATEVLAPGQEDEPHSRSTSNHRRRKRGARKGKGSVSSPPATASSMQINKSGSGTPTLPSTTPITAHPDDSLATMLANASQKLAREVSSLGGSISRGSSRRNTGASLPSPGGPLPLPASHSTPPPLPPLHTQPTLPISLHSISLSSGPPSPATASPTSATSPVKKASKWKLPFGKTPSSGSNPPPPPPPQQNPQYSPIDHFAHPQHANLPPHGEFGRFISPYSASSPSLHHQQPPPKKTSTVANVSNLIMGLDAPAKPPVPPIPNDHKSWSRGRRQAPLHFHGYPGGYPIRSFSPTSANRWPSTNQHANSVSTASTSSASSSGSYGGGVYSNNWRSSTSNMSTYSGGSSSASSTFTRYSNASMGSVSTTATSVSSSSWRSKAPSISSVESRPPSNIKVLDGVPFEVDAFDRGANHINPLGNDFKGGRHQRMRNSGADPLGTITERPLASSPPQKGNSPLFQRQDASTSTSDLNEDDLVDGFVDAERTGPKKVHKAQITTLGKILSTLRR